MWYLLIFWAFSAGGSNGGVSTTIKEIPFERESSCNDAKKQLRDALNKMDYSYRSQIMITCVRK